MHRMKKYNIVFSIPVHEKYEVVIDLILNVFHYNPSCAIVLHYANGFREAKSSISFDEFESAIKRIGSVYVNPETVRTGMYDIIQAHVSNFHYIKSLTDFDYFALTASNELFIKEGLYNHIYGYDAGVSYIDVDTTKDWIISELAKQDTVLIEYLATKGWSKIMGSHVEGSFYRKDLMTEIIGHIDAFFDYRDKGVFYPRDEVFFPTFLWNISQTRTIKILDDGLYCWTPWNRYYKNWDVFIKDITRLLREQDKVFSVKRVPRLINNYVRRYLRKNAGYIDKERDEFVSVIRGINTVELLFCESAAAISASYRYIKNVVLTLRIVTSCKSLIKKFIHK